MKNLSIIASLLFAATFMFAFKPLDATTWKSDQAHSNISFTVLHFGITDIEGSFKKLDAKFTSSKEDFTDAVFEFTTEVNSITTNDEQRDGHLKSPDFFDAAKFATITFKSKSVKRIEGKNYKITGELTMHGITQPIEWNAVILKGINLRSKKEIVGVKVTGTLNRSAFGIGTSVPAAMVSDEITIKGSAEFGKE